LGIPDSLVSYESTKLENVAGYEHANDTNA
jgi:hypothetical protein